MITALPSPTPGHDAVLDGHNRIIGAGPRHAAVAQRPRVGLRGQRGLFVDKEGQRAFGKGDRHGLGAGSKMGGVVRAARLDIAAEDDGQAGMIRKLLALARRRIDGVDRRIEDLGPVKLDAVASVKTSFWFLASHASEDCAM